MEEKPYSIRAPEARNGVLLFVVSRFSRRRFSSASADSANGPNRKSLAGLGVGKMRGEGMSPLNGSVTQMRGVMGRENFLNLHLFRAELLVQVNDNFLQGNDTLWNAFERRKQIFCKNNSFSCFFLCFLRLEHECSVNPT